MIYVQRISLLVAGGILASSFAVTATAVAAERATFVASPSSTTPSSTR